MIQKLRTHADAIDIVDALGEIHVRDLRAELRKLHGKIRVLHLARQYIRQRSVRALWTAHREPVPRHEQRREKWEALDVIPVRVAQENVCRDWFRRARHQMRAERPRACAAVKR